MNNEITAPITVVQNTINAPVTLGVIVDGGGGGVDTFAELTDKATVDLPTINGPLSTALSGKAPSTGIAPSAISGTAVVTNDSRLSDARTPTPHPHVSADVTDTVSTARTGQEDNFGKVLKSSVSGGISLVGGAFEALTVEGLLSFISSSITTDTDTTWAYNGASAATHRAALKVPASDATGITGADAITNIISLTAAEYAALGSTSSTTLYVVI